MLMSEESEETKAPPKHSWSRNPFAPFRIEILQLVIYPKILELVEREDVKSKTDLLIRFKEAHNSGVSMTTFDEWLSDLGITFERVTKVNLPEGMKKPVIKQRVIRAQQEQEASTDIEDEVFKELS
tara:strand:- start:2571 stop:2948 length:378 start_codon:yes stop_codon:yes gene_type:complete